MTSCLSDMRTVRLKGLTFRITQPYGLRVTVFKERLARDHARSRSRTMRASRTMSTIAWARNAHPDPFEFRGSRWTVVLAELTAMAGETAGPDGDPYAASLSTVGRSLQFASALLPQVLHDRRNPIFR